MQAHKAAYLANVPDKIAGALTLDSVKHYYQNRDFALAFLRKLESRWLAESNGGASLVSDSTDHEGAEDIDNFHPSLDKVVELVRNFFAGESMSSNFSNSNGLPLNLRAELVAYAATYIAMNKSGRKMPSGCWNTFKRAIETECCRLQMTEANAVEPSRLQIASPLPISPVAIGRRWILLMSWPTTNFPLTRVQAESYLVIFSTCLEVIRSTRAHSGSYSQALSNLPRSRFSRKWSAHLADAVIFDAALQGARSKRHAPELRR